MNFLRLNWRIKVLTDAFLFIYFLLYPFVASLRYCAISSWPRDLATSSGSEDLPLYELNAILPAGKLKIRRMNHLAFTSAAL